jgi:hypothetical protein
LNIINIVWRDPSGNLVNEQLDRAKFKIRTEPGWLKIDGNDGPVRFIPADKVCLAQFAEVADEPRILRPDAISSGGPKAVPS